TQALRGDIETLRFESENAATRQRELYLDVDSRLQALEQSQARLGGAMGMQAPFASDDPAGRAPAVAAGQTGAPGGTASGYQEAYQAAFELLRTSRYEQAATAFSNFLTTYANSPLVDNAQY